MFKTISLRNCGSPNKIFTKSILVYSHSWLLSLSVSSLSRTPSTLSQCSCVSFRVKTHLSCIQDQFLSNSIALIQLFHFSHLRALSVSPGSEYEMNSRFEKTFASTFFAGIVTLGDREASTVNVPVRIYEWVSNAGTPKLIWPMITKVLSRYWYDVRA